QADERGAGGAQAAGGDVDPVVDLPDGVEHARPRLGRNVRRTVEDARRRRLGDVRGARDIVDGGFPAGLRRAWLSRAHIYHSWRLGLGGRERSQDPPPSLQRTAEPSAEQPRSTPPDAAGTGSPAGGGQPAA